MGVLITVLLICAGTMLTIGAWSVISPPRLKGWNRPGIDRPQWPEEAGAYDTNPPQKLDYNYIDWLEARLEVGAFDPDRIEMFGPPKGKSAAALNAQIAYRANKAQRRRDLETHEANKREDVRRAKAEQLERDRRRNIERIDYVTGEYARFKAGGVLRTMIDDDGNETTIRSFGG